MLYRKRILWRVILKYNVREKSKQKVIKKQKNKLKKRDNPMLRKTGH